MIDFFIEEDKFIKKHEEAAHHLNDEYVKNYIFTTAEFIGKSLREKRNPNQPVERFKNYVLRHENTDGETSFINLGLPFNQYVCMKGINEDNQPYYENPNTFYTPVLKDEKCTCGCCSIVNLKNKYKNCPLLTDENLPQETIHRLSFADIGPERVGIYKQSLPSPLKDPYIKEIKNLFSTERVWSVQGGFRLMLNVGVIDNDNKKLVIQPVENIKSYDNIRIINSEINVFGSDGKTILSQILCGKDGFKIKILCFGDELTIPIPYGNYIKMREVIDQIRPCNRSQLYTECMGLDIEERKKAILQTILCKCDDDVNFSTEIFYSVYRRDIYTQNHSDGGFYDDGHVPEMPLVEGYYLDYEIVDNLEKNVNNNLKLEKKSKNSLIAVIFLLVLVVVVVLCCLEDIISFVRLSVTSVEDPKLQPKVTNVEDSE